MIVLKKTIKYSRLSTYKIKKIIACFAEDIPAIKTVRILQINRNTINLYYNDFRLKIFPYFLGVTGKFLGGVELDKSYFGAKRVKDKRGRGAAGKTLVLVVLKRNGNVFVEIVQNCTREQLMPIIQGKILENSTIYIDGWRIYDGLILNGYEHCRTFRYENEFARDKNHVNGIESLWSFTKQKMGKLNGIHETKFILHLKESEFRWNQRNKDLEEEIWRIFKRWQSRP